MPEEITITITCRLSRSCTQLVERRDLSAAEAAGRHADDPRAARPSPAQIAAFLVALRMKGETVERAGGIRARHAADGAFRSIRARTATAARYLRHRRRRLRHIQYFDRRGVRGGGRRRARGQARQPLDFEPVRQRGPAGEPGRRISPFDPEEIGARHPRSRHRRFCSRPAIHTAMKHAQPVRVELKMRTVFNLLGPLTNPGGRHRAAGGRALDARGGIDGGRAGGAGARARLRGARLRRAGRDHDHGSDAGLRDPRRARWSAADFEPRDFGVSAARHEDIQGGDAQRESPHRRVDSRRDRKALSAISCS